jgi:hypothetical protein
MRLDLIMPVRDRRAAMIDDKDNRMVVRCIGLAMAALAVGTAHARGVSPYLPLEQSPEIERQIERLLILADEPILTRPIAAATVLDALPKACQRDAVLCDQVRRYLDAYMHRVGLGHASVALGPHTGVAVPLPNRHGLTTDSNYEVSALVYFQPSDHVLLTAGGIADETRTTPTGTVLSFGNEYLQVDLGYRDHWLSPMTDSAMLLGTEAPTMPSVTASNYAPLSRVKFRYEAFVAEMSESSRIVVDGNLETGRPRLAGVHLSIEPFAGWSLSVNRLLQFGGAGRPGSLHDLFNAFFRPSSDNIPSGGNVNQEFGNQAASFATRFLMPSAVPFAVYMEYAGEDTSTHNSLRLGNVALSAGVQFPKLGENFDLTVEVSEWQNAWYVHHIYLDGLTNEGDVIGHWGADRRQPGDGVGARSWMTRLGWQPKFGGFFDATYRHLENQSYTQPAYTPAYDIDVRYSRPWRQVLVGAELNAGHDSFGESYSRVTGFVRF